MLDDRAKAIVFRRRAINSVAGIVALTALSAAGGLWRTLPRAPSTASFLVLGGLMFALIATSLVRSAMIRRLERPRCSACGELVAVDPNWKMDRASTCPACGRRTTVVGRP